MLPAQLASLWDAWSLLVMEEQLTYKVSATIAGKYAPIINRSRMLHEQMPKSEFPRIRESGATNIDVWIDGSIYPHHPGSKKRPSFRSVSDLLEFVGEGKKGLLGYVESLSACNESNLKFRIDEAERENCNLQANVRSLTESIEEKNRLLQFSRDELLARQIAEEKNQETSVSTELLKSEVQSLKKECHRLNAFSNQNEESCLQLEINHWIEIESLRESYEDKINSLKSDLKRTTATLRRREQRLQNLTKTPYGYRTTIRMKKDLSCLASTGGQAKRRLRLLRSVIAPTTTNHVQTVNQETGSRQRLRGDKMVQIQTGKVLASLLSETEVTSMCESSKLSAVGIRMANFYLDKIGENVGANEICETMDRNGITQAGYAAVYKQFKGATRAAGRGLRIGCLPNPHQISLARSMLNLKLSEYVGKYYSIVSTLEVTPPPKSKSKDLVKVSLNEFNSIFVDVEQVQRTMVELYEITPSGNHQAFFVKCFEFSQLGQLYVC